MPVDWEGTCGDGVPAADLLIENGACDLMSYESYDQQFDIVNDACFKVIRLTTSSIGVIIQQDKHQLI